MVKQYGPFREVRAVCERQSRIAAAERSDAEEEREAEVNQQYVLYSIDDVLYCSTTVCMMYCTV